MPHFMNPQRGRHMSGEAGDGSEGGHEGHAQKPHISIHSHPHGHTVHIMHHDGKHEKHEHAHGDTEGIAAHIHQHLGDGGQDHGYSSGGEDGLMDEA